MALGDMTFKYDPEKLTIGGNAWHLPSELFFPDDLNTPFKDWFNSFPEEYQKQLILTYGASIKDPKVMNAPFKDWSESGRFIYDFQKQYDGHLKEIIKFLDEKTSEIESLKSRYDNTSSEQERYELSAKINSLYKEIDDSGARKFLIGPLLYDNKNVKNKLEKVDKYINTVDEAKDREALDAYNARQEEQKKYEAEKAKQEVDNNKQWTPENPPVFDEWGRPVDNSGNAPDATQLALDELNNGLKNGLTNIYFTRDEAGNPVISGHVGYTYDDTKLDIDTLNGVINQRINEALNPFLQSSAFTTRQKIDALDDFFVNNPQYTNADVYNIVKFKNNLFSDINSIATSTLTDEEKVARMNDLATQYEMWAKQNSGIFPFALTDMWNDFSIDKDLTQRGLLKLAVDTTVDGQELSKALDMYLSNKSIYDEAIKNYEGMVNSYTPDKLEALGEDYGDIESKYNAQKVDKQVTNAAKGLGQSETVATQLGNQAQYQNYAENLAQNQMEQTDAVTDYAQNRLDNEYAKVRNAYNNAMQSEQAVMGEVDKNQADINAYLTKKGVDIATDKYNYDRKVQPVQVATGVAGAAANAVDKLRNK